MSDYFMRYVSLHLKDETDLRNALDQPTWKDWEYHQAYRVRSDYIIAIIDEIVSEGKFPYNSDIQRKVEARLNIPKQNDNNSPLSLLVYNAQAFRRSDININDGFEPFTQELLERAGEGGQIAVKGETMLGMPSIIANVKSINGKLYAMQPRKRKYALSLNGAPAKIIKSK